MEGWRGVGGSQRAVRTLAGTRQDRAEGEEQSYQRRKVAVSHFLPSGGVWGGGRYDSSQPMIAGRVTGRHRGR